MKEKLKNKYIAYGVTAFSVIAVSIILYFFILRFNKIIISIGKVLVIFRPLLYGIVIAFFLTQIYNFFEKRFNKLLSNKFPDKEKTKKLSKIISIALSIIIMFFILFIILYVLIPKLINSIIGIIDTLSEENINNIELWLEDILKFNPLIENIVHEAINDSSKSILIWISEGLLPTMENIFENVTTGLNDMYVFLKDFIIGLVFSIYILANKSKFIAQIKKVIYSIFGIKKGNSILQSGRYSYSVFNGFIKGKLLTSIIIGVACYIGMLILKLPYALLISLIVATTNIIPFFGPIIGWIPSVILIILVNPIQALYFTILIVILQQIEGNIIEPKIVGNNTGISGFWVLFSIIIFGDLFGFVGMIIGVPIFAIIYHFAAFYLKKYLAKKELPINTEDYNNLKYIDETTRKPVKIKSSNF